MNVLIEAYKKCVDRAMIRYCLKLTPEQRFFRLQRRLEDFERTQRLMAYARAVSGAALFPQWTRQDLS